MLKVIKYDNANAIEATWHDANKAPIRSIAYSDVQMDLFRADVAQYGGNIADWENLIAEVETNIQPPVPEPVIVPSVVSMRQARLALYHSGLLAQVNTAVSTGSEDDKIAWEYATEVRRDDYLVFNLSQALGLTSEQLDNLFTLAASL